MIERDELARRIEPVLSETPESARDLMARAGLATSSRIAGVVTVALLQLKRAGKARSHGMQPNIKWTRVTADQGVERIPLARLDATLIFTTTTRTTVGGTRRTELAASVELGPSWPAGTHPPPRWSTAFSDAQIASGALDGARTNALARAEAQLRALRKDKTLPLLPTEEPSMTRENPLLKPSKNRDDFLAYLASIDRGARQDSACAWLAKRGIAQTTEEALEWLNQLVIKGLLEERIGAASDGSRVVRYAPAAPTTPAPLPKSSAPAEEVPPPAPAVAEPKAKPAPAREPRIGKDTYRGAPPKARPAPVDDQDTGDPTDDEGALDDPAEHDSDDPPEVADLSETVARLTRERDDARAQVIEADRWWKDALAQLGITLNVVAPTWAEVLDQARRIVQDAHRDKIKADDMRLQFCSALGLSAQAEWRMILDRMRDLILEHGRLAESLTERASAPRPAQTYQGDPAEQFATSIAGWLVGLSDETWLEVTRARHQLAESRKLREQSHSLELHALDALDRAVGARPAAPAPEPTPEPPASGEQANDGHEGVSLAERVRKVFEQHPDRTFRGPEVAKILGSQANSVSGPLSNLARDGVLEKPAYGQYRLARKGRRAA